MSEQSLTLSTVETEADGYGVFTMRNIGFNIDPLGFTNADSEDFENLVSAEAGELTVVPSGDSSRDESLVSGDSTAVTSSTRGESSSAPRTAIDQMASLSGSLEIPASATLPIRATPW